MKLDINPDKMDVQVAYRLFFGLQAWREDL